MNTINGVGERRAGIVRRQSGRMAYGRAERAEMIDGSVQLILVFVVGVGKRSGGGGGVNGGGGCAAVVSDGGTRSVQAIGATVQLDGRRAVRRVAQRSRLSRTVELDCGTANGTDTECVLVTRLQTVRTMVVVTTAIDLDVEDS